MRNSLIIIRIGKMKDILLIIVLIVFSLSCSVDRQKMNEVDLVQWYENDNNYVSQFKETDGLFIEAMYQSGDYILSKEFLNNIIGINAFQERKLELINTVLFKVSLGLKDEKSLLNDLIAENEEVERYLRADIKSDFRLQIGENNYMPSLVHLESGVGLKSMTDLLIAFSDVPNLESAKEINLIFDNKLADTTTLEFRYHLNKIPELSDF